jgi:hypothetical protein
VRSNPAGSVSLTHASTRRLSANTPAARTRKIAVVVIALGVLIAAVGPVHPELVLVCVLLILGVAVGREKALNYAIIGTLAGLLLLSYGFNNIPVPALRIPIVEPLALVLLAATHRDWIPFTRTRAGRPITAGLVVVSTVGLMRLPFDVPEHGVLAFRDLLWVIDLWALFLGIALVGRIGAERTTRMLEVLFAVATLWYLAYPLRETVASFGPSFGVQRAVPLLDFTLINRAGVLSLFWFLLVPRKPRWLLASLALATLMIGQSRGSYLAIGFSVIVLVLLRSLGTSRVRNAVGRRLLILVPVAIAGVAVLSLLPLSSGRLGSVGPEMVVAQLATLAGEDGPGSGTFNERQVWWQEVWGDTVASPAAIAVGRGFGTDLLPNRALAQNIELRTPHNDLLELFARGGILLVSGFLVIIVSVGRPIVRSFRYDGGRIAAWGVCLQVLYVVTLLTQPMLQFAYSAMVYALLSGMVIGILSTGRASAHTSEAALATETVES